VGEAPFELGKLCVADLQLTAERLVFLEEVAQEF
jgi:hypothetical protein